MHALQHLLLSKSGGVLRQDKFCHEWYHYMSEKSFTRAVGHFSEGNEELPLQILRIIRDDVRGTTSQRPIRTRNLKQN